MRPAATKGDARIQRVSTLLAVALVLGLGTGSQCTGGSGGGDGAVDVSIGTIPAGREVVIEFDVTVNQPLPPGAVTEVVNQGTVSGSNFAAVVTDDPDVPGIADPTVTPIAFELGDLNRDGVLEFETDFAVFQARFGDTVTPAGEEPDYDGDGVVGQGDYGIFFGFF